MSFGLLKCKVNFTKQCFFGAILCKQNGCFAQFVAKMLLYLFAASEKSLSLQVKIKRWSSRYAKLMSG